VIGECSGDTIEAAFAATPVITTWYDDAGNLVRRLVHADIPGTVTNLDTGTTLETTGVRILHFDLVNGGSTSTGTNVHVVLPGEATLQLVAGHVVVDDQAMLWPRTVASTRTCRPSCAPRSRCDHLHQLVPTTGSMAPSEGVDVRAPWVLAGKSPLAHGRMRRVGEWPR
jgi:hypothetical protein